ncbi:MAG TPA: carboxylesterase family protein, partial [Vicinamibacterales bacterium]|nr:carboxylesterase family protein [Vicinamibacterales bacterium]
MTTSCRRLLAASLTLLASSGIASAQAIKTRGGDVVGVHGTSADVLVFRGIPYAAPPVGDRRWAAPEPAVRWAGVL